jgi:CDP-glycerol glycerophosphotransferase (TagB/SpsB family)
MKPLQVSCQTIKIVIYVNITKDKSFKMIPLVKKSLFNIFSMLNYLVPKTKHTIIFLSSPDLSDNSFALFKYMAEHKDDLTYIWLVDDIKYKEQYRRIIQNHLTTSHKKYNNIKIIHKKSIWGIYLYIRSKYIFFTHGFYTGISLPKHQTRINLWHGMPLKSIGYLNKNSSMHTIPKSSITIATSEIYRNIMAQVFKTDPKNVFITGQPKCDFLTTFNFKTDPLEQLNIHRSDYQSILFWAPTYRYAKDHDIKDGKFKDFLPVLKESELSLFNDYLSSIRSFLLIKLHPMDILNQYDFSHLSHIKIIKDEDLLQKGIQLYSLVSKIDILITDYSSLYIDFLLLDRPIIFAIDDFDEYRQSRNFVFKNPEKYMPGDIVSDFSSLKKSIETIIVNKHDSYIEERKSLKKQFHTYTNHFSKRLVEKVIP